jgi:hypothetical protein
MNANAIMFQQPVLKVYLKLPPSRKEMEEVLAVVFTGACDPTPEDFERTPLLVRREKVAAALEWLKLNHEYYSDLEISEENLATYALRDVIVRVDYRRTEGEVEHSVPESARSVFDNNEEHGTSSGPCPFVVHGLTGAEYWDAPMSTITAVALQHLTSKGKMLGIGQLDKPESLYKNVAAYPSMFPWLFPYGKGGIGHETHRFILSDKTRKRSLLLYHDKRFQTDTYFPMIAFNHEQLKGSSKGSRIIVKKSKFADISRRLLSMDPTVAGDIADRMVAGETVKPQTDQEIQCFELLRDLDGIGAHVPASATSKKHMRNEIWSMTSFMGAPTWFITMAWSDVTHPISLYYAQTDTTFQPNLMSAEDRGLMMSKNPVAAARFFDFMVQVFIKEILCWENVDRGLFGHTKAYYATVEQQGRLTLHLHSLLWITNSLSPQVIRDKIMAEDSVFTKQLVDYLESSHQGEFIHGPEEDVHDRVNAAVKNQSIPYRNPVQTLPEVPPKRCAADSCEVDCKDCSRLSAWMLKYEHEVDDILIRSNIHDCRESIQDKNDEDIKKNWRIKPKDRKKTNKQPFFERRGCLVNGVCKSRFPRDTFEETGITEDGHINLKKLQANMNSIARVLTSFSRCNTDVTGLMSGTAVKAVISYCSDYIAKLGLKTYQAFASVFDVFDRHKTQTEAPAEKPEPTIEQEAIGEPETPNSRAL